MNNINEPKKEIFGRIEYLNKQTLTTKRGHKYELLEVESEYIICVDVDNGNKIMTGWCGELETEDEENLQFLEAYEKKLYGGEWKTSEVYISPNGNEYWVAQLIGWQDKGCHDVVGIFSTTEINDGGCVVFDKMIDYSYGANIDEMVDEIKALFEESVKKYEEEM